MRALPGDRIVVDGTRPGLVRRDGEAVGLHHLDGSPPFEVRWSDPDARVAHFVHPQGNGGGSHVRQR